VIRPPPQPEPEPEVVLDYVGGLDNAAKVIAALHRGEKRLVFRDSRARVEGLAADVRARGVVTFVSHSSLGLDERREAERAFAAGRDCVIVATSALELGIDVGDLDRVIQIDVPPTVSSFLQRMGRTGRRPGTTCNALLLATSDEGLLRAAGLVALWRSGFIEPAIPPPAPRHILAQVMGLALQERGIGRSEWREWIGAVPAFRDLDGVVTDRIVTGMLERDILVGRGRGPLAGAGRPGLLRPAELPRAGVGLHGAAACRHPSRPARAGLGRPIDLPGPSRRWAAGAAPGGAGVASHAPGLEATPGIRRARRG
jgi:ATP-dependent Lhr-like helicase